MSNRLFQGIIYQMKDAIDRVIGVIDENGVITTDKAISFESKQELGDGYAMRAASSIALRSAMASSLR